MKKKLVAVYGTLRKLQGNNYVLGSSPIIGEFDTDPIFDMYSINASFPGIIENGDTSIKMEVYEVEDIVLNKLDRLEGYYGKDSDSNHYERIVINTPYGPAFTYVYNPSVSGKVKIESGDWVTYKNNIRKRLYENDKYGME